VDRLATLDVELVAADLALAGATVETLADGANRALIGGEVLQFAEAVSLGSGQWRLRGLLRGRGGTETAAQAGQVAGAPFVLLDDRPIALDPAKLGSAASIAAIGLVDGEPVSAQIANPGLGLRPLVPVHPRKHATAEGGLLLEWTRRARGAWNWPDAIETPLNEQAEGYLVGLGDADDPDLRWELAAARLELSASLLAELAAGHAGKPLWVRQVGSFAVSEPLLLTLLA
jgi:hypothetical protein